MQRLLDSTLGTIMVHVHTCRSATRTCRLHVHIHKTNMNIFFLKIVRLQIWGWEDGSAGQGTRVRANDLISVSETYTRWNNRTDSCKTSSDLYP